MPPFWFRLIEAWCLSNGTGLTLPFIVGANARARKTSATSDDVRRILQEIVEFETSDCLLIMRWCPHRSAPVFGVYPFKGDRLEIDQSFTENGATVEKVLEDLAQGAEMRVRDGDFSRIGIPARWAPFEPKDYEFIDSVIAAGRYDQGT